MHQDAFHHGEVLFEQAACVVEQAILFAQRLNVWRDFGVAVCRHVRKEVVLNLVAQMPGHDVKQAPTGEIARARELAQIPVATGFIARVFFAVDRHTLCKVATEDHHIRPQIANQVGAEISGEHARCTPQCQRRKQQIVFEPHLAHLGGEAFEARSELFLGHRTVGVFANLQIMRAHAILKTHGQQRVGQRLQQVPGLPALGIGEAQQ